MASIPQQAARRAVQDVHELLHETAGWKPPKLERKALVHLHCHQRPVLSAQVEEGILQTEGLKLIKNPAGCWGVAGAFGYETDHYAVSMNTGGHDLLPLVRKQGPNTLIISDGFSCWYRVKHGTRRWTGLCTRPR